MTRRELTVMEALRVEMVVALHVAFARALAQNGISGRVVRQRT